jgi:erythromycin esterase
MRSWIASLALAACSTGTPSVSTPVPLIRPVAQPAPVAPPSAPVLWPELNLGFEQVTGEQPTGWRSQTSYAWTVVGDPRHGGDHSLRLRSEGKGPFGAVVASVPADAVRGKHLILRGWIKTDGVKGSAAMFLRVDGGGGAFDNMADRGITGTADWTEAAVDVDVPAGGDRVVFGPMLNGEGTAWFDDLRFELGDRPKSYQIVLQGSVVDAAGKPIPGAEVALIGDLGMKKHVRCDANGAFHFDAVPGRWGFSAHHAGEVGSFIDRRRFDADAGAIQLTLGATDGVVVHGTIGPGKPASTAYVAVSIVSSHDADAFAVPVVGDGTFEVTLPRSQEYSAQIIDGGMGYGSAKRTGDRAEIAITMPVLAPPPQEVVDWIGAHAIPLATAEAGNGLDDIAPIARLIGKARVVALGEATHGTREFFQLKHRVLEYLVAKQGFTVFAIEANQPECRAINEYVLHGTGDPKAALDGIYFWTWNTEEVLAMIEWMRAWNSDPRHPHKVQFLGFDMQTSTVAYASLAAFLGKLAPDAAPSLLAPIEVLGGGGASAALAKPTAEEQKRVTEGLAAIANAFDAGRKAWARKATAAELDEVRHDLTILEQATEMYMANGAGGSSFNVRDRSMAANIQWILGHQPPGTRMVVWAHNGHIANRLATFDNMGSHLRRQLKTGYVNLGFVFSQGSFQAIERGQRSGLNEITLGDPPESNASVAFARTGKPLLVLDLRALPARGTVHDWFAAPHPVRDIGAVFTTEQNMTVMHVLPVLYDAVIFVDRTTRARPVHPRN